MRIIKRYKNRKLYDTVDSRYVNLSEIFNFVRGGESVKVVNNTTQADITADILLSAVLEQDKATPGEGFTTEVLTSIIKTGNGTLSSFVGGYINA